MKQKKQKKEYVTPVVTVFSARIEKGYQLSASGREPFGESDTDGGWTETLGAGGDICS